MNMKALILLTLCNTVPLACMQVQAPAAQRAPLTQEQALKRKVRSIHQIMLHTDAERNQRDINDVAVAGYIDEAFKEADKQTIEAGVNVHKKRTLAHIKDTLTKDALKLAGTLDTLSTEAYNDTLHFRSYNLDEQAEIMRNFTRVNSLYNALIPILEYTDNEDFAHLMRQSLQKITVIRHTIL